MARNIYPLVTLHLALLSTAKHSTAQTAAARIFGGGLQALHQRGFVLGEQGSPWWSAAHTT